jgi:hypothetical protein
LVEVESLVQGTNSQFHVFLINHHRGFDL